MSLPQVGQPGDPDYRARCQPTVPISKRDTLVIHSRAGKFDSKHVWAPSIVRVGLTYYMFYTGVDAAGDQRMGLATSTDLFNWTQLDEPIFDYLALGDWAAPEVLEFGNEAQFRDPFVMPDPAVAGQWLMYFVTVPAIDHGATVVGVAQSSDLMQWVNDRPLMNTLRAPDPRAESPHAFFSQGQWWLFYTSSFDSPDEELELSRWGVYGQSNPANPTDGIAGNWSPEAYVDALIWDEHLGQPTGSYFYWKGSEYLRFSTINDVQFMAAWNDQSWGISITRVNDTVLPTLFVEHCGFDPWTSVDSSPRPWLPRLLIASLRPGDGTVELAIEMAQGIEASLAVHDVQGRVVRRLFHGRVEAGRTRLSWNGHGDSDRPLGPGVYFARLSTSLGGDTVRIPIVR